MVLNQFEIGNAILQFATDLAGAIGTAVVHQKDFVVHPEILSDLGYLPNGTLHILLLVVSRNDDGKTRHSCHLE
jgi:hypothetical protein